MPGVQSLPTWTVVVTAVAAAGAYIWRWVSLMITWKQKTSAFKVVAVTGGLAVVLAGIKHNSVNHALVLFADVMLGLAAATLPLGQKLRTLSRVSAETGVQQALSARDAKVFAAVLALTGCVLLLVEYALL